VSSSEQAYQKAGVAARSSNASSGQTGVTSSTSVNDRRSDGSASGTSSATRPHPTQPGTSPVRPGAPRRVRLTIARVDPWSVMKLSFLLSVAIGIALVVAAGVLWTILDGMGVFGDLNGVIGEVLGDPTFDVGDYIGFGKVVSLATVIAVIDVVLLTAIATLGAFLYNIATTLVGGLHVTLSDD
jgi:hypothetical protein